MKRKKYQRPIMKTIMMQKCYILAASDQNAKGEGFTWDE